MWSVVGFVRHLIRVPSASSLVALTLTAGGAWLLANGLKQWRTVVWVRETGASRSPAPYGHSLAQYRPILEAQRLAHRWVLVVRAEGEPKTCEALQGAFRDERLSVSMAVLLLSSPNDVVTRSDCPVVNGHADTLHIPVVTTAPITIPGDSVVRPVAGFAVADSSLTVLYGSRAVSGIGRLPSVLRLFQ